VILARAEWLARRLLDGRNISLRVHGHSPPTRLLGDPDLLCQVLLELVANAAAVTPSGGEISIDGAVDNDTVILAVRDQGPGIPADARERIFDPFFSRKPGGTGIGLTVARQIVQSHGGTIVAEAPDSPDTRGARFEIRLPSAV
jgi:signal transduction histidine kinase